MVMQIKLLLLLLSQLSCANAVAKAFYFKYGSAAPSIEFWLHEQISALLQPLYM